MHTQTGVHGEPDAKVTRKGFKRFLVDSPLQVRRSARCRMQAILSLLTPSLFLYLLTIDPSQAEASATPDITYGSHHGLYYLDSKLIALAVLDILPGAVSSVYLAWHPDYASLGLGKISALREIAMVREMQTTGLEDMTAYMMGQCGSLMLLARV